MESKRENSVLIPYKVENGKIFVFLQKRDKNSRILPDHFSFFGGNLEPGESPKEALIREIKEELDFKLEGYQFLGIYNSPIKQESVLNVYFTKVNNDFEDKIKINEGEYGKFLSQEQVIQEPMLIESDKKIIKDLYNLLRNEKNDK